MYIIIGGYNCFGSWTLFTEYFHAVGSHVFMQGHTDMAKFTQFGGNSESRSSNQRLQK